MGYPFVLNPALEEPALPQIVRLGMSIIAWGALVLWIVRVVHAH